MTSLKEIQQFIGVTPDGKLGPITLNAIAEKLGMSDNIRLPDEYWPMLAKIESNNELFAKAVSSSASGLYQFIRATWVGEGGKWGSDVSKAFGGMQPTAEEQLQRAKSFTLKNAKALVASGITINPATLYAAHFLGAGTAISLLRASNNARADYMAGVKATRANPSILQGKTVAQFRDWLHRKTGYQA